MIDDPLGILLGTAIEDAYAGESCQVWAGAMLTKACREFADRDNYIQRYSAWYQQISETIVDEWNKLRVAESGKRLVLYSVPTQFNPKDGRATYGKLTAYVIDWTIRMYEGAAEKAFHSAASTHDQEIAKNTQAFEEWARANNR